MCVCACEKDTRKTRVGRASHRARVTNDSCRTPSNNILAPHGPIRCLRQLTTAKEASGDSVGAVVRKGFVQAGYLPRAPRYPQRCEDNSSKDSRIVVLMYFRQSRDYVPCSWAYPMSLDHSEGQVEGIDVNFACDVAPLANVQMPRGGCGEVKRVDQEDHL
jgi:hypothetical protein